MNWTRIAAISILVVACATTFPNLSLAAPLRETSCQAIFARSEIDFLRPAGYAAIAAVPKMRYLTETDAFLHPRFIVLSGGEKTGKTYSLVEGVFPILNHDGITTSLKPIEFFFDLTDAMEEVPTYSDIHVLAIDNVDLSNINFARYKDLARLIQSRYDLGLSTLLLSRSLYTVMDLNEILGAPTPNGLSVEAVEFPTNAGLTARH